MKRLSCCLLVIALLISCKNSPQAGTSLPPAASTGKNAAADKDSILLSLTKQVLTIIKDKRYKELAAYIHPESGLRFSSYAYVDTTDDLRFTQASWLKALKKSQTPYTWGSYDGSGDAITLTIPEYFGKFVYDADFLHAEQVSVNKMIGGGNSLNNLETIYKDSDFTESYFSGFDKKLEGMDWRTLRLVFKKHNERYYLTGIVHDQWTI